VLCREIKVGGSLLRNKGLEMRIWWETKKVLVGDQVENWGKNLSGERGKGVPSLKGRGDTSGGYKSKSTGVEEVLLP